MRDFLEYMQALHIWQPDARVNLHPLLALPTAPSQFESLHSLQSIPTYAKEHSLLQHPWLLSFRSAEFSRSHLQTWLRQRYLISWCFPNWLMAVTSRLPTPQTRIPLLVNLLEEHGLVTVKGHSKPHPEMWQQLFKELEAVEPEESLPLPMSAAELLPGTLLYLQTYTSACFGYPAPLGLGTLVFTESILPHENWLILEGLRKLGVSSQGQEFFTVHSNCDEAHAEEILNVVVQIAGSPEIVCQVWQGVEMAATARRAFYDGLLNHNLAVEQSLVLTA